MDEKTWIVSVLFKGGTEVVGMCTSVKAPDVTKASIRGDLAANRHAKKNSFEKYAITNVGIADNYMAPPEGWWEDPLADPKEDWEEMCCSTEEK